MNRIVASLLKPLWRMTSPVRRPLLARLDARVSRLVAGTVDARMMPPIVEALADSSARLERIERTLGADLAAANLVEEVDVVLNGLTREVFRLQSQVERLQRGLNEAGRPDLGGLSILDPAADDAKTCRAVAPVDRTRVG